MYFKFTSLTEDENSRNPLQIKTELEFLSVCFALEHIVVNYGINIDTNFSVSFEQNKSDCSFVSRSTVNDYGKVITLHCNKPVLLIQKDIVQKDRYNSIGLYFIIWSFLYNSSKGTNFYELAQNYVDNNTALVLLSTTFSKDIFIPELTPSFGTLIDRIRNYHIPFLADKFNLIQFSNTSWCNNDSIIMSNKSVPTEDKDWDTDINLCIEAEQFFQTITDFSPSFITNIQTNSTVLFKPPPSIYPYSFLGKEEEIESKTKKCKTILQYITLILHYEKKNNYIPQILVSLTKRMKSYLVFYFSFLQLKNQIDKVYNFDRKYIIPPVWSCKQIEYARKNYNQACFDTVFKFFKVRIPFNPKNKKIIAEMINSSTNDLDFYSKCRNFLEANKNPTEETYEKGAYRVEELKDSGFFTKCKTFNISNILDFGGGSGEIIYNIAETFGIKTKESIVCYEISEWNEKKYNMTYPITYHVTTVNHIPYPDQHFNLITCFVSLHHLNSLDRSLKELSRVCANDGLLLIREHDCNSEGLRVVIDIEHSLFELTSQDPNFNYLQSYYATYWSKSELESILKQYGFEKLDWNIVPAHSNPDGTKGPTRYYYSVFKKQASSSESEDYKIWEYSSESYTPSSPFVSSLDIFGEEDSKESEVEIKIESKIEPETDINFYSEKVGQAILRLQFFSDLVNACNEVVKIEFNDCKQIVLNQLFLIRNATFPLNDPIFCSGKSKYSKKQLEDDMNFYGVSFSVNTFLNTFNLKCNQIQDSLIELKYKAKVEIDDCDIHVDFFLFSDKNCEKEKAQRITLTDKTIHSLSSKLDKENAIANLIYYYILGLHLNLNKYDTSKINFKVQPVDCLDGAINKISSYWCCLFPFETTIGAISSFFDPAVKFPTNLLFVQPLFIPYVIIQALDRLEEIVKLDPTKVGLIIMPNWTQYDEIKNFIKKCKNVKTFPANTYKFVNPITNSPILCPEPMIQCTYKAN